MAKNTSISLGEHFDGFIAQQLEVGRYGSASEVVRAALRLLEDSESKLNALRRMLNEGEQSGLADYSYETFIAELDSSDIGPQR
jgi:antitoxin ParD1/3/4